MYVHYVLIQSTMLLLHLKFYSWFVWSFYREDMMLKWE